jgi:hypothetical protein
MGKVEDGSGCGIRMNALTRGGGSTLAPPGTLVIGGQNPLTILAYLRAAARHQRSTVLARLRVNWAPPGIAPWLDAEP